MANRFAFTALFALLVLATAACGSGDSSQSLIIYSGRSETLIQPLLTQFAADKGIDVRVRYGTTSGTVALLLEEGDASPADVVLLQDAGALGALANEGRLAAIPADYLARVDSRFSSRDGNWVGISGRVRTVVYNTETLTPEGLPDSIMTFVDPAWKGRIGWAPTNGSFQAFVTALRITEGDDAAKAWLEGIKANQPTDYANNTSIVDAVARGEVEVGFVNHYYLQQFLAEQGDGFAARNYFIPGDVGGMMNVAGVAILKTAEHKTTAEEFVDYVLSEGAQAYFAEESGEYPLIAGVASSASNPQLAELNLPDVDLGNLDDLRGTLDLMREAGVLP
jgi:iron(III) transport system substrate-binding protein